MNRRALFAAFAWLAYAGLVHAEHAIIDLRVFHFDPVSLSVKNEKSASADEEPPLGGLNPRPLMKVKAGESLVLQFIFTNTYPHKEVKDVSVRYFVARVDKVKQKTLPDLSDAVIDGKFTLNFKPKGRVGARVGFAIPKPGIYMVRVESLNTQSDHEHFSSIDLEVE
jgi:hypothetical protein